MTHNKALSKLSSFHDQPIKNLPNKLSYFHNSLEYWKHYLNMQLFALRVSHKSNCIMHQLEKFPKALWVGYWWWWNEDDSKIFAFESNYDADVCVCVCDPVITFSTSQELFIKMFCLKCFAETASCVNGGENQYLLTWRHGHSHSKHATKKAALY